MLSESLGDEPHAVEARRRIPVIGRWLSRDKDDVESSSEGRPVIVTAGRAPYRSVAPSSSQPRTDSPRVGTPRAGSPPIGPPTGAASQLDGEPGTRIPPRREIRFPDEVDGGGNVAASPAGDGGETVATR